MRRIAHTLMGLGTLAAVAACSAHDTSGDATEGTDTAASAAAVSDAVLRCTATNGVPFSKYKTAFFGNLHQHTMSSLDAFTFGTRSSPADAYLFAKKQKSIQIGTGTNAPAGPTVTIDRPLDFLAVTDH